MIETKLAEQPEQFQDEHGAWHVGREIQRQEKMKGGGT